MSLNRLLLTAVVIAGTAFFALPATQAANDDPTPEEVAAGTAAFKAAGLGNAFDKVLPLVAEQIQNRLVQQRPDLTSQITDTVQAVALKLVPRRKELDTAVGKVWAKTFTLDELKVITEFYNTEAGHKYLTERLGVEEASGNTMRSWSQRVADELNSKSREELKKVGF